MNRDMPSSRIVPFAVEAAWASSRWETLRKFVDLHDNEQFDNFNFGVARVLLKLMEGAKGAFKQEINSLRNRISSSLTFSATASIHASHESLLRCHVLTDLEIIAGVHEDPNREVQDTLTALDRRLEVLGAYVNDKQYILGIRRAAMELMR